MILAPNLMFMPHPVSAAVGHDFIGRIASRAAPYLTERPSDSLFVFSPIMVATEPVRVDRKLGMA